MRQKRKKHFDSIQTAFKLHFKRGSVQKMDPLVVYTVACLTINNGELGQVDFGVKTFIMMISEGYCYQ